MFYWIYDLPTWTVAIIFAVVFIAISWFGAIFIRPVLRLLLRNQPGLNDGVGYILSFFSVVYGLLLGMLAIATYQALSDAEKTVVNETAALTSMNGEGFWKSNHLAGACDGKIPGFGVVRVRPGL